MAQKGEHLSAETIEKIRLSKLGENNPMYGKHHSDEARQKISRLNKISQKKGSDSHIWKGDKATYSAFHKWVHKHKPRPENCDMCHKNKPHDVACINGVYDRNPDNYHWLCRSCHQKFDFSIGIRKSMKGVSKPRKLHYDIGASESSRPDL